MLQNIEINLDQRIIINDNYHLQDWQKCDEENLEKIYFDCFTLVRLIKFGDSFFKSNFFEILLFEPTVSL